MHSRWIRRRYVGIRQSREGREGPPAATHRRGAARQRTAARSVTNTLVLHRLLADPAPLHPGLANPDKEVCITPAGRCRVHYVIAAFSQVATLRTARIGQLPGERVHAPTQHAQHSDCPSSTVRRAAAGPRLAPGLAHMPPPSHSAWPSARSPSLTVALTARDPPRSTSTATLSPGRLPSSTCPPGRWNWERVGACGVGWGADKAPSIPRRRAQPHNRVPACRPLALPPATPNKRGAGPTRPTPWW